MIKLNLRLPDDLHAALKLSAKQHHRSLNAEMIDKLRVAMPETLLTEGGLATSDDSGKTWKFIKAPNAISAMTIISRRRMWVGTLSGLLFETTDSGKHWRQLKSPSASISDITFTQE